MKKNKFLCSFVMFICLVLILGMNSYALASGFSVEELSESDKENIKTNFKISLVTEAPLDKTILRFDVNEKGMIALGHNLPGNSKKISVYDSEGNFKYGYIFESHGTFGVEWNGDYLNIYLVRSDLLVTVDIEANIVDITEVQDTKENNAYGNQCLYGTERVVGDTKYTIRNRIGVILDFLTPTYSQLVKTSSDGTETILYDVNTAQLIKMITITVLVISLLGAAVYFIFIKPFHQEDGNS